MVGFPFVCYFNLINSMQGQIISLCVTCNLSFMILVQEALKSLEIFVV